MKKLYLALFFSLLIAGYGYSQCTVVLTVDDSARQEQDSVKVRGSYNGWMDQYANDDGVDGDAVAGDNIWSVTVTADESGDYEWGAEGNDGVWLIDGDNRMFSTDADCNVTGDTSYVIPAAMPEVEIVLTVTDETQTVDSIQFKGSFNGWSNVRGYDDGTNGDAVAADNIWTAVVLAEVDGSYEWGAERLDCPNGPAWIISGPNRMFSVDADGNVTGETDYTLASADNPINVTFRVDMSDEIVSSEGLFVGGAFEVCPWTKNDLLMTEIGSTGVYETTVSIAAGQTYEWKFFNGAGGDPDGEANDSPIFSDQGCGVANPFGGANRVLDLTNAAADTILPTFIYNSCDITTSVRDLNVLPGFEVSPNPFSGQTTIVFENPNNEVFNLTITDLTGKVVEQRDGLRTDRTVFHADQMQQGIYFATLRNEKGEFATQKIILQ